MKIKIGLFFTNTNQDYNKSVASTWIRIWQMMDIYRELGAEVHLNNYTKRYDVAIVYRKSKRKYYYILKYLKLTSKKVYFDTCINLFEVNEEIDKSRLKYAHKIAAIADGIICASKQIEKYATPLCKSTHTLEDPINFSHFRRKKKNINFENPIFGWSGAGIKAKFLNHHTSIIDNRIHIISEKQINEAGLNFNYTYTDWRYETFPDELLKCDIALLPRDTSSSYNKGHSSFKALVYASLGIPIIANKIPSYLDLAKHYDAIVFLEDFDNNIKTCIQELEKRSRCIKKVEKHYSLENQANQFLNYLHKQLKPQKKKVC